jgi:predicted dehydrogenase
MIRRDIIMSYEMLTESMKVQKFHNKKVLIIGAGFIAKEYFQALRVMGIGDVKAISCTEESARKWMGTCDCVCLPGGYLDQVILRSEEFDLIIIALPVHLLKSAAQYVADCGQKNILVEKPASLYSEELRSWGESLDQSTRVRIAYNRLVYPNLLKLRDLTIDDGGIKSCHYMFTEWIHTINFNKDRKNAYDRWGISNSSHVISMAHSLVGMPKQLSTFKAGGLPWHKNGSRFTGAGITESDILFSYHADWNSAGRWGIEVTTEKQAYRLIPLEELYMCRKGSIQWEKIDFEKAYPSVKQGIAEEITLMLDPTLEKTYSLPTIEDACSYTQLIENIFGYPSKSEMVL